MKKLLNIFILIFVAAVSSGCNHYVKISDSTDTLYYGALNRRDLTWADVIVYKKDSDTYCDGIAFFDSNKHAQTAQVRLACTDGKLLHLNWDLNEKKFSHGKAIGIDQYNNQYTLLPIKRNEYVKNSSVKYPAIPNSKTKFVQKY